VNIIAKVSVSILFRPTALNTRNKKIHHTKDNAPAPINKIPNPNNARTKVSGKKRKRFSVLKNTNHLKFP
jgi:hypothetical protein